MNSKFVKSLFKESGEFIAKAEQERDVLYKEMFIKSAIAFSWFGLEGIVNFIISDFEGNKKLELHERAFLEEKSVSFKNGIFSLGGNRYYSTTDKILFALKRFGNYEIDRKGSQWSNLCSLEQLRHAIVHPKTSRSSSGLNLKNAKKGLITAKNIVKLLYKKIYKKNLGFNLLS